MGKTKEIIALALTVCLMVAGCGGQGKEKTSTEITETVKQKPEKNEDSEQSKGVGGGKESDEGSFSKYKTLCIEEAEKIPLNDSYMEECLEEFEDNYFEMLNLKDITQENGCLSGFVTAISYLYSKFDEGTAGHNVGEKGWEAVEMLAKKDEGYETKMQELKTAYEETGNFIFSTKHKAGQYKVGEDIESGEYVLFVRPESGYFCVSSDPNCSDIIANDNFDYNSILTVQNGEYLKLDRCYAVPIAEVTELPVDKADMFKIGTYLPAGEYKLDSEGESGYYCVYSDGRHSDIVANDNFEGQSYVTVADGQYLLTSRCHIVQ